MSDTGVPIKVPISAPVTNLGTVNYNNQNCTNYLLQISATNEMAQSVTLTPPSGVYVVPTAVSVPASGSVNANVYVPTSKTGAVTVTASETGFDNRAIQVLA